MSSRLLVSDGAIANGDPVYVSLANKVKTGDAVTATAPSEIVGIVVGAVGSGVNATIVSGDSVATGVLVAATPGAPYYCASGGGLTATKPVVAGNAIVLMGYAKNTTDLWLQITQLGVV